MRSGWVKTVIVFLALILAVVLAACTHAPTPTQATTPKPGASSNPSSSTGALPSRPAGTSTQASPAPANQAVTVKGDGTIAVDKYANLYFGSAGQIVAINVKAGDRVTKGTALAKLDTANLEAALAQATVNLDQAKLAQTQAKSALVTAQFNLDKTKPVSDIKDSITDDLMAISTAQVNLNQAQATGDSSAASALNQNMAAYQKDLKNQQTKLANLLSQDPYTSADAAIYINGQKYDRLTVEDIQNKQLAVQIAQQIADKSQDTITQAQKNLDLAQTQLNQATISAPFDGVVASVNQNTLDVVSAPSSSQRPIIYLIDPSTLELIIGVNELDMPKVKIGQKAVVVLNAYPDIKIDAKVFAISTLPIVQGGITDYNITITITAPANVDVRVGMNATAVITSN